MGFRGRQLYERRACRRNDYHEDFLGSVSSTSADPYKTPALAAAREMLLGVLELEFKDE